MVISKGDTFQINDRFLLHIATDHEKEFEEILEFNVSIHEETIREYLNHIFFRHPRRKDIYWLYIKDLKSEKIVSSIALLPLEWRMGPLSISICEMGFVGTAESYRRRGLVRELNAIYEQIMQEKGYIFSVLRGIPYFYRKLGYEFSFPLDNRFILPKSIIPSQTLKSIIIHNATLQDLEFIEEKYENYHQNLLFWNAFWKESFTFKHFNSNISDLMASTYIIEEEGKDMAYFTLGMTYDKTGYKIRSSSLTEDQCIKLLQFLKDFHDDTSKNEIDLDLQNDSILSNLILQLGGYQYQDYGWQVKIPSIERYLRIIKNLLEERIRNSDYRNLSQTISISNYQETFKLHFEEGKIIGFQTVKEYPAELSCGVQIPGPMLYKLLLGDKNFEEIKYILKDAMIKHSSKPLISVLFPKKTSFPETYY